jgi:hypothetical protein
MGYTKASSNFIKQIEGQSINVQPFEIGCSQQVQ